MVEENSAIEAEAPEKTGLEEFREELPRVWAAIPDKPLFFGLLAGWLLIFQFLGNATYGYIDTASLFGWMKNSYDNGSDDAHGSLIPFAVLALFWWKREALARLTARTWWPGVLGLAGAMGLHILGYAAQQPQVSVVAMFTGVYSLMAMVWGWRVAVASFFPFVMFVFCVPLSSVAEPVTVPLRGVSADVSVFVLRHLLGIPILQVGVQLLDPHGRYTYEVAAACSGMRSVITLLALTTAYGWVNFDRWWKRLFVVGLAIPLALVGNVFRLVSIVVAAEAFGQEAGAFVHDWFGFVTFVMALGVLMGVGHWLREPEPPVPDSGSDAEKATA
ncbi:MAG: exosortase/archaeosortase family protein [Verrucomicrobiae bacterium]|nr:exosortase/archaeosortase family protein [Verrucomicrobiae bacterium]MCP5521564.1 exosortase/archaeosortase family protein [Verrucomicrobiales bacterium]